MPKDKADKDNKYGQITGRIVNVHLMESKTPLRPRLVLNVNGENDQKKLFMEAGHTHADATFASAVTMVTAAYFKDLSVTFDYLKEPEKIQDPKNRNDIDAKISAHAVRVVEYPTRPGVK